MALNLCFDKKLLLIANQKRTTALLHSLWKYSPFAFWWNKICTTGLVDCWVHRQYDDQPTQMLSKKICAECIFRYSLQGQKRKADSTPDSRSSKSARKKWKKKWWDDNMHWWRDQYRLLYSSDGVVKIWPRFKSCRRIDWRISCCTYIDGGTVLFYQNSRESTKPANSGPE